MRDGDGCTRESTLGDAGVKNGKGTLELLVLKVKRVGQHAVGYFGAENLLVLLLFSVYNTLSSQMTFPRKAIGCISILILAVLSLSAMAAPARRKENRLKPGKRRTFLRSICRRR